MADDVKMPGFGVQTLTQCKYQCCVETAYLSVVMLLPPLPSTRHPSARHQYRRHRHHCCSPATAAGEPPLCPHRFPHGDRRGSTCCSGATRPPTLRCPGTAAATPCPHSSPRFAGAHGHLTDAAALAHNGYLVLICRVASRRRQHGRGRRDRGYRRCPPSCWR